MVGTFLFFKKQCVPIVQISNIRAVWIDNLERPLCGFRGCFRLCLYRASDSVLASDQKQARLLTYKDRHWENIEIRSTNAPSTPVSNSNVQKHDVEMWAFSDQRI